jgi:hypothetical protein
VLLNKERLHKAATGENCRGYDTLYDAVTNGEIKGVKAFFLLAEDGGHKCLREFKPELLEELNKNKFSVQFDFLYYDPAIVNHFEVDDEKVKIK